MSEQQTIQSVAASLLVPEVPAEVEEVTSEGNEEDVQETPEVIEDTQPDTADDTDDDDEVTEETDEDEEAEDHDQDQDDEQADEDSHEPQILDLQDDDLIEVKIDGKVVTKTFGDALKALSGEGAIHARVQEATKDREAARQERVKGQQALEEASTLFFDTIKSFEDNLYVPLIPPPPSELKQSNPTQYIRHQEAYEKDQQRLAGMKNKLGTVMQEHQQARQQDLDAKNQEEARLLAERRPHMADPDKGLPLMNEMVKLAVEQYDFTPEEINTHMDHKTYMLLEDALRYRRLTSKGKLQKEEVVTNRTKAPRKLRTTTARSKVAKTSRVREQKAVAEQARRSGKPADVAKTLLTRRK